MTNYGTIIDNRLQPAPRAFMLQTALGWTDEQVEQVLAAAEGGV